MPFNKMVVFHLSPPCSSARPEKCLLCLLIKVEYESLNAVGMEEKGAFHKAGGRRMKRDFDERVAHHATRYAVLRALERGSL